MRKEVLLTLTLMVPVSAAALTLRIDSPSITFMSSNGVLTACEGRVDTACTTFQDASLVCACALEGGRWKTDVSISAQPRMYLSNVKYQLHELSHVFDFDFAMRNHAREMESRSFAQREECETFAAQQRLLFPSVLRRYVQASMRLRDGVGLPDRK